MVEGAGCESVADLMPYVQHIPFYYPLLVYLYFKDQSIITIGWFDYNRGT